MVSPIKKWWLMLGLAWPLSAFGAVVDIDCATLDQPLQTLIDAVPEDSTINLSGACQEPILITKDRIELSGGKAGASFTFPPDTVNGLSITGRQIALKKLNVSGAKKSVVVYRTGSARIVETQISQSGSIGLEVTDSSYVRILNSTISNSGRNGIVVRLSSSADIHNNVISHHQSHGIVLDSSAADIDGNALSDNRNYGLLVHSNSKARLGGDNSAGETNRFSNNGDGGVRCDSNSTLQVRVEQQFDDPAKTYRMAESCVLSTETTD
ncbi:MAG: right-handed parallel beta-helix repeat-containing protein [Candidatus Competibacteraceae bacterium]|nr:right-handed parallel beta-helix repeat-containing protein [Candidatus Competibacteraceae bacterium]